MTDADRQLLARLGAGRDALDALADRVLGAHDRGDYPDQTRVAPPEPRDAFVDVTRIQRRARFVRFSSLFFFFFFVSTDTSPDTSPDAPRETDVSLADETACAIERKKVGAFAALVDPDGSASASRSSLGLLPSARRAARCGSRGAPFGAGSPPLSPAATTSAGPRGANGWLVQVSSREPRSAATEPRF